MADLGKLKRRGDGFNVLTILVDQLRYDALSCMGNKVVHTPNLDRLAEQGTLFSRSTCAYPLCGPSRASILTGMYAHRHGFWVNAEIGDGGGIAGDIQTVDEILHENGYQTVYFGKWHTGAAHRECYEGGLEYYLKEYKEEMDRKYPLKDGEPLPGYKIDRYTKREYEPVPLDDMMEQASGKGFSMPHHNEAGRSRFEEEDSLTAWTVRRAIRYLESAPKEPFGMTCSILHPHAPLIAVEPYFSMFDPEEMPMPDNMEDHIRVKKAKPRCRERCR